jgi:hypothetical protein
VPENASLRRTLVRVQTVRRLVVAGGVVAPCQACGRDVRAVTPEEAAGLLRSGVELLERLVDAGHVHAIETIAGPTWICRDSLFRSTP